MPKTSFVDAVTVVPALWLNAVFGIDGHNHKGLDEDGSAPKITLDEIDDQLLRVLNDLIALKPYVQQLFYNDKPRLDLFGGSGIDGAFDGLSNLDRSYYEFTDFVVPSGQTVRATGGYTRIKVKGDATIDGLLLGVPCNPAGIGKAWYNTGGNPYGLGSSFLGSGGGEAVDHSDIAGLTTLRDRGGLGGSAIILEVLGRIIVNGTIACVGGNGNLSQILTGTPSIGGSGGGSGGSIILQSFTQIQINGTMSVKGGNGADGQGSNVSGGGGGGGGWMRLFAPEINDQANSYEISGGTPGKTLGTGGKQGAGGGGFAGTGGNHKASGSPGKVIKQVVPMFSPI